VKDKQTGGQTDNADHYYSWPSHCGGPANKLIRSALHLPDRSKSCKSIAIDIDS